MQNIDTDKRLWKKDTLIRQEMLHKNHANKMLSEKVTNEELFSQRCRQKEIYSKKWYGGNCNYIRAYMQNELQSKDQMAGLWYYGRKERTISTTTQTIS